MLEDWNTINLIQNCTETKINKINKSNIGEFWLETLTDNTKLQWLADTGSTRSFISQTTADQLINKLWKNIRKRATQVGNFRCFNNNKIKIQGIIQIDITSGTSSARECYILVVPHKTVNPLGLDILRKLGIQLAQTQKGEQIFNINENKNIQIAHKIFKK